MRIGVLVLSAIAMIWPGVSAAESGAITTSLRPLERPDLVVPVRVTRPQARPIRSAAPQAAPVQVAASNARFERWIGAFRGRAQAKGISAAVLDRSFRDVRYNPGVIKKDRNQSEYTKQIWDYLDSAASPTRVENGKAALRKHKRVLSAIEAKYGVDKEVVTAVWGLESAYGERRGDIPTIEALATLAFDGRRGKFFESQLIAALKIAQAGDVAPRRMTGSWAGAMGHTQFIPTSYLAYAVDFTGDGKRDIWSEDPTDALASTAAYLARFGWVKGQPWGIEVTLPRGFNYGLASRKVKKSPADWAALGVRGTNGRAVPNYGSASILLPAGAQGAAFMIFKNFSVIERYNVADAYVIGVGHLSDRLKGGPEIQAKWPRGYEPLSFKERKELQRKLRRAGFPLEKIDGIIGPNTIDAIRAYQRSVGVTPDGYPSVDLLKRLR